VASLPLEAPGLAAVLVTVAALLLEPRDTGEDRDRRAVLHIAACAGLLLFHHNTDQLRDYYRYLGGDTRRRGELVEATAAYLQVTRIDPTYGSGFYRLGDLYYRQGDYEAAAAPLARARKLMPGEWQVHLRAAQTYLKLDRPEEAVDAARAVLKLKPDEPTAKKIVTRYAEKDG
jgi:tetratricopeptide (TPR) repeat protein